jgi:putative hydrolase of HD superfamily
MTDHAEGSETVTAAQLDALTDFVHELGQLKHSTRTGWWLAGVDHPETVAEHTFRTAAIAYLLAMLEGADPGKAVLYAVFHDMAETRLGDIPSVGKAYLKEAAKEDVAQDQLRGAPGIIVEHLLSLVNEYEDRKTIEARLARDADKLECLAQALEYAAHGYPRTEEWVQGSVESVSTDSGHLLADALTNDKTSPDRWWRDFVAKYRPRERVTEGNPTSNPETRSMP